jgi:prepilin-type N-terminal cleavage/methylation domain-containing protein
MKRGFTLVEMLVVIGVIVTLVGLTIAVVPMLNEQSQRRQTDSTLTILSMAIEEWQAQADRSITFGVNDVPVDGASYDVDEAILQPDDRLGYLIGLISRHGEVKAILSQIDPRFLPYDDSQVDKPPYKALDGWGRVIEVVFPGRVPEPWEGPGLDDDRTLRTEDENRLGVAVNRRIGLVSGGPDGKLGNLHLAESFDSLTPDERNQARLADDNVYSYPLRKERPQ